MRRIRASLSSVPDSTNAHPAKYTSDIHDAVSMLLPRLGRKALK